MSSEAGWRSWRFVVLWLLAAVVSIAVGVAAVTVVGAGLRDRGPVGSEALVGRGDASRLAVDPDDPRHPDTITGAFGEFDVVCQGVVIRGSQPRTATGWRTVTYETGPDDDVDATFETRTKVVEIEVYCNGGRPKVAEYETGIRPDGESADD